MTDDADAKVPEAAEPAGSDDAPKSPAKKKRDRAVDVEVLLEVSRQRYGGWAVFGMVVGALLVWKLGTVGVWAGYVLIGVGLFRAYQLVMTFVNPPGTIIVSDREVQLPRGLSAGKPIVTTPKAVTAVYFLRKSVPWNKTAPILVVEVGARALLYPRDWFASEADQRHVVHALAKYTAPAVVAIDAA